MSEFKKFLDQLVHKNNLSIQEAARAMNLIVLGGINPSQIASYLSLLSAKGITEDEIVGSVMAIHKEIGEVESLINIRSTGHGNNLELLNISLPTSLIIASFGYKTIEFGKQSSIMNATSEILTKTGFCINIDNQISKQIVEKQNFSFFVERNFVPKLVDLPYIRHELGFKTLFDVIYPFLSPCKSKTIFIGTYDKHLRTVMALAAKKLGYDHIYVFANNAGIDKFVPFSKNYITYINSEGSITEHIIQPYSNSYSQKSLEACIDKNHILFNDILNGAKNEYSEAVVFHSAVIISYLQNIDIDAASKLIRNNLSNFLPLKVLKNAVSASNEIVTPPL